jgi:hypothetical protein
VESSCEFGIEPWGSMKCWELTSVLTTRDLSSSAQLNGVSSNGVMWTGLVWLRTGTGGELL